MIKHPKNRRERLEIDKLKYEQKVKVRRPRTEKEERDDPLDFEVVSKSQEEPMA